MNPLQLVDKAAKFKFESKLEPLQIIWQSLPKTVPEDNRRFWLQNQWLCFLGRAQAQLGMVERASTLAQAFEVSWSAVVSAGSDML